jgi:Zn ribbon nucleic-acid-binding protein
MISGPVCPACGKQAEEVKHLIISYTTSTPARKHAECICGWTFTGRTAKEVKEAVREHERSIPNN